MVFPEVVRRPLRCRSYLVKPVDRVLFGPDSIGQLDGDPVAQLGTAVIGNRADLLSGLAALGD